MEAAEALRELKHTIAEGGVNTVTIRVNEEELYIRSKVSYLFYSTGL